MKMITDADIVWDKREQSRIEAQIKKQQELKLIGSMKKVPGHTLFSFNHKTGEIKPADVIRECAMGFDGLPVYKERIVVEKDCYYEQALNVKNFVKRVRYIDGKTEPEFAKTLSPSELVDLAIVGAMAVDAEKEGRFIPAQETLKGIQKSKTDN